MRFISKITSKHFLLNIDYTRLIPLSQNEIDDSRMITTSEFLYRPMASIILSHDTVCEWRVFIESTTEAALQACELTPFITSDLCIAVAINEQYFIAATNGLRFREICDQ